ncbi:hypothetical protein Q3G72_033455 [Acer saccharum]|nr:hypothetical protein Q3G72_033455 [Acer saccharum]
MGKGSFGKEDGKSNSTSDGPLRGTDGSQTGPHNHHSPKGVASGGSVKQIGGPLAETHRHGTMLKRMEQDSDGPIVNMEVVETFSEGPALGVGSNSHNQVKGDRDTECLGGWLEDLHHLLTPRG